MMVRILLLLLLTAQVVVGQDRPNIILMMADDLGYGDVGFTENNTGQETPILTPHLDALAAESMELLNFYSIGPVCSPTRGSFLTGRHYGRFGIFAANEGVLPAEEITMAQVCRDEGYATGHFGKWHVGTLEPNYSPKPERGFPRYFAPPWERGYDVSFVTESSVRTWDPQSTSVPYYNSVGERVTENLEGDDSRVMMDRIIPFIEDAVDNNTPFLSVVWFHAPHEPFIAGPEYIQRYHDTYPDSTFTEQELDYYGCVTAMDDQVGRLVQRIEELGIEDNTIILFCSDNGPERNKPGRTGGLRDRKRSLYNGGVMVPTILKWPGKTDTPSESTYQSSVLDLLPTIVDILDYEMPDSRPLDGRSILPMLDSEVTERENEIPFLHSRKMAWIDDNIKFRVNVHGEPREAYNMITDRNEVNDIIGEFTDEQIEQLQQEIIEWNCSANWSYWGYDYPNAENYVPVDSLWKGLRTVVCDAVPVMVTFEELAKNEKLEVFPNPTSNIITLKEVPAGTVEVFIVNQLGNTVMQMPLAGNEVNVSELPSGFYTICLINDKREVLCTRMVKN